MLRKQFRIVFSVYFLWINFAVTFQGVLSSCPHLKPSKNVQVLCYNGAAGGSSRQWFPCNPPGAQVNSGTQALYQCAKYYKPTSRILNGGRLSCTETGWTKMRAFKDFRCELDCGKRPSLQSQLISFGNTTNSYNWPWIATIFRETKNGGIKYSCGGSLIGLKTVLTAAHCVATDRTNKVPADQINIFLGTVSSNFDENVKEGIRQLSVKAVHVHPEYHVKSLTSDIAIIELVEPVSLSDNTIPVCLPISYEHDTLVLSFGNTGEVSSFGTDETGGPAKELQYAKIGILSSANCHEQIRIIPGHDQYCAGNINGPNLCRGDSGSGMVFKSLEWHEDKYVIHGIVSNTGELSNSCAPVVVFSKVFSNTKWIHEILTAVENSEKFDSIEVELPDSGEFFHERVSAILQGTANEPNLGLDLESEPAPSNRVRPPSVATTRKPSLPNNPTGKPQKTQGINSGPKPSVLASSINEPKYTKTERAALSKIRPLVNDLLEEDYMQKDEYLIKFLRTKKFDLEETKKFMQANMEWRKMMRMNEILDEDFTNFQREYTVFFEGADKGGRPITTTLMGLFDLRKIVETGQTDQFRRYLSRNCEEVARKVRSIGLKNISQSVAIFDMHGFNARQHMCLQCLNIYRYFVRQHEAHFPQEAYVTFFINMPPLFENVLNVMRPFFSEHTKRTIKLFGTNKEEWRKELLKFIPADQLFKVYGGTKVVKETERELLAL